MSSAQNPAIEPELLVSLPRKAVLKENRRWQQKKSIFLGILLTLLFLSYLTKASLLTALEIFGIDVPGKIFAYEIRPNEFANPGIHYFLGYQFEINGKTYEGSAPTTRETYLRLKGLVPIEVRTLPVLPNFAKKALITQKDRSRSLNPNWFIDILFAGFPLFIYLWFREYYAMREKRLVEYGQPIKGTITGRTEFGNTSGPDSPSRYVFYEFKINDTFIEGKMPVSRMGWGLSSPGDIHTILYDPKNPRNNILYKYAEFHAEGARSISDE